VKDEIYRYKRRIEWVLKRVKNSSMDSENKKKILEFYHECIVRGYSKARIIKYIETLERIATLLGKPFSQAKKEDIAELIERIEEKDYSDWTKYDYKVVLRVFYKWLRKTEDYPEEVRWIKMSIRSRIKLPEELLTVDDIMRLVDAADNLRDKAFVLVLYESGCRIGEILSLQIKHVQFDEYGAVLLVNGKTGQRRVRVILSAPKLNQWVENHPLKNANAPLWVTIGTNSRNKVWTYGTAREVLKKLAKRAGIKKRIYPHLFRHSRATHLANHLTEAQMKQYFGWVQGSDMASVYVHLSGRDVDNALFKLNGMEVKEDKKDQELRALVCPRCKTRNSPDAKFCSNCGLCLDAKTSVEIDEIRIKLDRLLDKLTEDPQKLSKLIELIESIP
jgi:site-specific recombinase XerD/ribosomal protein L40E